MDKNKFFLGLMIAVVGLFMLISPDSFMKFAVIILGITLIFDGIFILVTVRNLVVDKNYALVMAVHGWLSIAVGLLAVLLPMIFAEIFWTIMAYTMAVYLLAAAGMEIYAINMLSRNGISTKKSIFEVIICVILAIILFILPSDILRNTLVSVFGVILIIIGVAFALVQWKLKPIIIQPDSVEDIIEEAEAEAEAEEESSEKTEKQDKE
ncbi:MAG: DUF308 domain-containing protein [Treponema sp.]|nr:DUF308 domain-containing protein [Treponema sp.]